MKKSALILGALLFVLALVSTAALAVEIQAGKPEFTVNTATPTIVGFGGKQWVTIGYDGVNNLTPSDTLTLLLAGGHSYGYTIFSANGSNVYSGSTLQEAMNDAYDALPAKEQLLLIGRTLTGGSGNYGSGTYDSDHIAGATVTDASFWPLSAKEADAVDGTLRNVGSSYWLRSPGYHNYFAALVWSSGGPANPEGPVEARLSVRPAFILKLSSVLFTSAAAGGKNPDVSVTLSTVDAPGTEVKFTMLDNALTLGGVGLAGGDGTGALAFAYDPATAVIGDGKYISCVLEQGGAVKYYGKLEDLSNNAGSGTVSVPLSGVSDGTYTLKIFSEQDNGNNATDFAGTPSVRTLAVSGETGTIINTSGTGSGGGGCDTMAAGAGMAGMLVLISALWSTQKTQKTRKVKR